MTKEAPSFDSARIFLGIVATGIAARLGIPVHRGREHRKSTVSLAKAIESIIYGSFLDEFRVKPQIAVDHIDPTDSYGGLSTSVQCNMNVENPAKNFLFIG